jgi:hypothetical protein
VCDEAHCCFHYLLVVRKMVVSNHV